MKDLNKTVLRLWLVIWVITLPLVHIHPEADHAHGMSGHVHGGTYHSILVNTPVHAHQDHDQEEHHHDGFFLAGDGLGASHSTSHPPHDFEEATYGFSVIKPSIVLESEKSQVSYDMVVTDHVGPASMTGTSTPNATSRKRCFSIRPATASPRAPPVLSI